VRGKQGGVLASRSGWLASQSSRFAWPFGNRHAPVDFDDEKSLEP
jgi:urease accessory protein UreE